jgi:AcrR family transcriptional regulator
LFARQGYDGTTFEDIGKALHITGPALYKHFRSKDELFVASMAAGIELADETIRSARGLPPRETLTTILRGEVTLAVRHNEIMLIWRRERYRMPASYRKLIDTRRAQMRDDIDAALAALRPDLDTGARMELRNLLMGLAFAAAGMTSKLSKDARIGFLVASGLRLVDTIEA